ncbi:Predicted amidohydrolase [Seinonella peptonophila]|uniref:Predicted amidohydrolase n=1 Tax=Seinonella peptonophila TaxID=112248 RepID=A0A1M4TS50_9BACL|nr:nitrilase-related carbon-nitrogen hydrolase [Seinonella peptonophila]SHE47273.1 Predicted amidohydrolase [Seinonella peptonophila]
MKVGIAQIRPFLGRVDQNLDKHAQFIEQAKAEQVDMIVFPELSLTGYNLLDLTFDVARVKTDEQIQSLVEMAAGIDIVFGYVEKSSDHLLYNTAVYASDQKIVHTHRKTHLPTYGMFDEGRYFGRGQRVRSFPTKWGRMGMLICEEVWHPATTYLLAQDGVEIFLFLVNSPVRDIRTEQFANQREWRLLTQTNATVYGAYTLFASRVGSEDGATFLGNSHIIAPDGEMACEADIFEEQLLVTEIDLDQIRRARFQMPLIRDENLELTIRELKRIQKRRIEEVDGL